MKQQSMAEFQAEKDSLYKATRRKPLTISESPQPTAASIATDEEMARFLFKTKQGGPKANLLWKNNRTEYDRIREVAVRLGILS